MIENPILSSGHPQTDTYEPIVISDCTNIKCNEEIYSREGIEYNGEFYCSTHCVGEHLVNEGYAIDMSVGHREG